MVEIYIFSFLDVFWTEDQNEIFMSITLENIHTKTQFDATLSDCEIKAQKAPAHPVHLQPPLH